MDALREEISVCTEHVIEKNETIKDQAILLKSKDEIMNMRS